MKILIVEDSAPDRDILATNLRHHGCEVIEAADGIEGLDAAERHLPDAIISDALMPRMDGFNFLRAVKRRDSLKHIPFVIYSAVYTGNREIELALSLGAAAFIVKPKEPDEFWEEFRKIIKGCSVIAEARPVEEGLLDEDKNFLMRYSHIVAVKLEEKVMELHEEINRHKKTEQVLRETTNRLQAILDASPLPVIALDLDGKVVSWNPAAERVFGWEAEDVLGRSNPIVPQDKIHEHNTILDQLRKGKSVPTLDVLRQKKDGTLIPVSLSTAAIRDASGEVRGFIGILMDLSEKKRLEDQLRQAQKMEAIGQLTGGIAHDFNNILTAIVGYATILKMGTSPDDPDREHIDHILSSAERAANLTQSLLAFSRKQVMNLRTVDINEIIGRVDKLLRRLIGEDVEFHAVLGAGPLMVKADPGQLEQVLMNLAVNARDAMPNGGSLRIETGAVALSQEEAELHGIGSAGSFGMITVSDTGMGMDEETRRRIFEPFFTTKEVGKGTGLGLSVVYGIIRQHDGYINVYSEPKKGTTFRIYIPLAARESTAPKEKMLQEEMPAKGTETVLLAEDDAALRSLSATVLSQFGYTVIEADDGEDAVKKYIENRDRIHILLFDLLMPKKSGLDAFLEIKKLNPSMRVVFMSGYPTEFIEKRGLLEKGHTVVMKPVSPTALLRALRNALDKDA